MGVVLSLALGLAATGLIPSAEAQGTVIATPEKPKDPAYPKTKSERTDVGTASKKSQRMLLAPGCYVLMPGSVYAASAYCVDKDQPAAEIGVGLSPLPVGLGDTSLRIGGKSISLQEAVANRLIAFESLGRGDYFHISIRNLSDSKLEICVRSATLIAADSAARGGDLTPLKAKIDALLPALKNPKLGSSAAVYGSADEQHAVIQQKLWDETSRARDKALRKIDPLDDDAGQARTGCPSPATPMTPPTEPTIELKCGL